MLILTEIYVSERLSFTAFHHNSPCLIIYLPENDGKLLKMKRLQLCVYPIGSLLCLRESGTWGVLNYTSEMLSLFFIMIQVSASPRLSHKLRVLQQDSFTNITNPGNKSDLERVVYLRVVISSVWMRQFSTCKQASRPIIDPVHGPWLHASYDLYSHTPCFTAVRSSIMFIVI